MYVVKYQQIPINPIFSHSKHIKLKSNISYYQTSKQSIRNEIHSFCNLQTESKKKSLLRNLQTETQIKQHICFNTQKHIRCIIIGKATQTPFLAILRHFYLLSGTSYHLNKNNVLKWIYFTK